MFAILALIALPAIASATVAADALSFSMIAAYPGVAGQQNASGQFDITIRRGAPGVVSAPLICADPAQSACYSKDNEDPFLRPLQGLSDEFVQVSLNYKTKWASQPFQTYQGKAPVSLQVRICYSAVASLNRAWRSKNKAYPEFLANCPFATEAQPFSNSMLSESIVATYQMSTADVMPTATFFVSAWITCDDGTVCAFDTTEFKNYIQVQKYDVVTPGLTAAATVLSVFSVAMFFTYFALDNYWFKKTGKGFQF